MKGLKRAADRSKTTARLPLYYCSETDTVYTEGGKNRDFVTFLIRPNTADEIKAAVEHWKRI